MMPPTPRNKRPPPRLEPPAALAWSESVLENPERRAGSPALALWRSRGVWAAIGLAQKPEVELYDEELRQGGAGLVRRQSGGGAVLLYPGVICWEAWASLSAMREDGGDGGIRHAYTFLSRPVVAALTHFGLPVFAAGICDLSVPAANGEARKLAGTAQLRRKETVLVHGSLLVDPDLDLLARSLRRPSDEPEYRRGRSHRDFCTSVAECLGREQPGGEALEAETAAAITIAGEEMGWDVLTPPEIPTGAAAELEIGKYRSPDWNWHRHR